MALLKKFITKTTDNRLYKLPVPIIGLTGGIATGKSTVAQFFRDSGHNVLDADFLVKTIYKKTEALDFITLHFPSAVSNNQINFRTLRDLVFNNENVASLVENFIYSHLPQTFLEAYSKLPPKDFVIYDVPLLFEKKLDTLIDCNVCVYSPRSIQLNRLVLRDGITEDLALKMLSRQWDIEDKKKKSTLIIENLSDLASLKLEYDKTIQILLS